MGPKPTKAALASQFFPVTILLPTSRWKRLQLNFSWESSQHKPYDGAEPVRPKGENQAIELMDAMYQNFDANNKLNY